MSPWVSLKRQNGEGKNDEQLSKLVISWWFSSHGFSVIQKKTPSTKKQVKHPKFPFQLKHLWLFSRETSRCLSQPDLLLKRIRAWKWRRKWERLSPPTFETSSTKHHLDQRYLNQHQLNLAAEWSTKLTTSKPSTAPKTVTLFQKKCLLRKGCCHRYLSNEIIQQ